jgi:hypothetical protein
VLAKNALDIATSSSSNARSLGFCIWRQSCRDKIILKMQSAGWHGNLPSIVNLLCVVHKDQHWAAKKVHTRCLGLGAKVFRIVN